MFTSTTKSVFVAAIASFALLASPAHASKNGIFKRIYNVAPVISGTPDTSVLAGNSYRFQPTASDANGDSLTFKINGKPQWATFSSATGTLSGTPSVAYVGTYANIVISVSDGMKTTSLPAFSITVSAPTVSAPVVNHAPTISGTPVVTAQAAQPYAFKPTAADADGDALTFSIANKPVWASFDTTNGTLYGTPADVNVGTYANVVITVSDGKASTSLAAFSITVAAAATQSVTLSWTPPTQNVDGTPVTDLAGFKVFYGTASGQYSSTLSLPSTSMNSVVIEGLTAGTWYFAVKAVNAAGVESAYSAEASKLL